MNIDYIAFGPIFETKTKDYHIGIEDVKKVNAIAKKPIVFIGGITSDNIAELLTRGASNFAMIRSITQAEDITAEVMNLKRKINEYQN